MPKKEATFEHRLADLEKIVQMLDSEDVPLEKAIEAYEKGVKLSLTLNQTLEAAQRKIEILTETARDNPKTEPFEEVPSP